VPPAPVVSGAEPLLDPAAHPVPSAQTATVSQMSELEPNRP
jgi:hypothetical protein